MKRYSIRQSDIRQSKPVLGLLFLIIVVIGMTSADEAPVGSEPFPLLKFGLIGIPDSLSVIMILVALGTIKRLGGILGSIPTTGKIALSMLVIEVFGVIRGFGVDLPHVDGIGPEARGFFFTCCVMAAAAVVVYCKPDRAILLVKVLSVCAIARDALEYLMYGQLMDGAQGGATAIAATALQAYAVLSRGNAWWLLALALPLDFFLLTSHGRTPLIELALGIILTLFVATLSPKAKASTFSAAAAVVLAVLLIGFLADTYLLNGLLADRIASLDVAANSDQRFTSNYEHKVDMEEALALALDSPILGYGTGTRPERYLTLRYGPDTPIHSPHLNSWIRFGILGLLGYCALQILVVIRLFRATSAKGTVQPLEHEYKAILIAATAYLWGRWALPPFYASSYFKECLCLGMLLGSAFALETANPLIQGIKHSKRRRLKNGTPRTAQGPNLPSEVANLT